MASHHGCHQHQQQHHLQSNCYSCCCSCSSPQLSPADPLLQAIATRFLQQQQTQQPHHLFTQPHHHTLHHEQQEKPHSQALYTSLVRRISALESSLHHLSSSSSSSPPPSSLKDHAARTIQTHFRAHLVRRSQTLRNLKHLAIIKTALNTLKSSISDKPHFNPDVISQKAMDLLRKLDSIQGGDPMIRDGKRSMSRELVQFLEFIDGVSIKRRQLYSKTRKNVRFADVERSRVSKAPHKQHSGKDDEQCVSSDDQTEELEKLRRKIESIEGFSRVYEEDDEESQIESEAPSSDVSSGERNPKIDVKRGKHKHGGSSHSPGQNGNSMFCPPLPLQMESDHKKIEKIARDFNFQD